MEASIGSVYLCVRDMDRAVSFYENILGKSISSRGERMSSFDFDDYSLLLYNPEIDGEDVVYGNNTIINFLVDDINETLAFVRSQQCEIVMKLEEVETFMIFQCEDTEGNVIEFFQEI